MPREDTAPAGRLRPHRLRKPPDNAGMCLIALAWKLHPRWRLLLAANRDEFHARPTAPLARWPGEARELAGGRDLRSGGTWLAVDAGGRLAAVTNVRDPHAAQGGPSRGSLPLSFLRGAADVPAFVAAQSRTGKTFAPFNLLVADAEACGFVGNHPPASTVLAPGIHGISNGAPDAPWPKVRRLEAAVRHWLSGPADDPAPLWHALADETVAADQTLPDTGVGLELERRLSPVFLRDARYGTRAGTLVAIGHDGRGWIAERRFGPDGIPLGETRLPIGPA